MAWNEPGGGDQGDKDPWGNRDKDGPPDLDEAFRKLQGICHRCLEVALARVRREEVGRDRSVWP